MFSHGVSTALVVHLYGQARSWLLYSASPSHRVPGALVVVEQLQERTQWSGLYPHSGQVGGFLPVHVKSEASVTAAVLRTCPCTHLSSSMSSSCSSRGLRWCPKISLSLHILAASAAAALPDSGLPVAFLPYLILHTLPPPLPLMHPGPWQGAFLHALSSSENWAQLEALSPPSQALSSTDRHSSGSFSNEQIDLTLILRTCGCRR